MAEQCYLCASNLGADGVAVCAGCVHRHLAQPVRHTAEMTVPALPSDLADHGAPAATAGSCTWCGKAGESARKLLGNGTVSICDECVALCADVMEAELGKGWRG